MVFLAAYVRMNTKSRSKPEAKQERRFVCKTTSNLATSPSSTLEFQVQLKIQEYEHLKPVYTSLLGGESIGSLSSKRVLFILYFPFQTDTETLTGCQC